MPATFPNSVRVYTAKTDLVDTVLAEHVNLLQDEVTAVQSTLGTGLLASTWAGTYTNPSTHTTVAARLTNIEAGLSSLDSLKSPKASPTFTGTVTLPLSTAGFVKTSGSGVVSSSASVAQSEVTNLVSDLASKVGAASPALTGTPTAPTAAADTATTQIATTAFVVGQAGSSNPLVSGTASAGTSLRFARQDHVHPTDTTRAPLASPTFTGTVTLPLSTAGFVKTSASGVVSSSASVTQSEVSGLSTALAAKADLASPTLTGTPAAPTAATANNSTQIATTAYVVSRIANDAPAKTGSGASGTWGINITGSAATLGTPRTITLSGDIKGSASFDGSTDVTITTAQESQPFIASFMMAGL